jgi:lysophospholipid acyltransferase (LPLAT)-like uncharacterized protein
MTLRVWLGSRGLYLFSQVVRRTARYEVTNRDTLDELENTGRPIIFTSWHGTTMMIAGYLIGRLGRRTSNMLLIVPDDWRGETLGEWARLFGAQSFAVGMEDTSLNGARHLLQMARRLRRGMVALINPDGPDGPPGVPKPGISFLAGRSGAAVLPLGLTTSTRYQLSRWDRYSVPYPFSRITMVVGEPLTIGRREPTESAGGRIAAAINKAMAEAERLHRRG